MTDETAGPRITELRRKITQLQARRDRLTHDLATEPQSPPPAAVEAVRNQLREVIAGGSSGERKRAVEALTHEIRIEDDNLIPVFKIPQPRHPAPGPDRSEPAATSPMATGSRNGAIGGAGGARTHDRRIMSPLL